MRRRLNRLTRTNFRSSLARCLRQDLKNKLVEITNEKQTQSSFVNNSRRQERLPQLLTNGPSFDHNTSADMLIRRMTCLTIEHTALQTLKCSNRIIIQSIFLPNGQLGSSRCLLSPVERTD
jgi:hypothetical protein